MKRASDPAVMTSAERVAEMGAILAAGYRRFQIRREKGLDAPAPDERSCEPGLGTESLGDPGAATGAVPQSEGEIA